MKSAIKISLNIACLICMVLLGSCSNEEGKKGYDPSENVRRDIQLTGGTRSAAAQLGDYYVKFTKDFIGYVDNNPYTEFGNAVCSPLSASFMLSVLANGIDEEKTDAIMDYLGVSSLDDLNELAGTLLTELAAVDSQTKLRIVDGIWVNNRLQLTSAYTDIFKKHYGGEISYEEINSGTVEALKRKINQWCSDKTEGLIKDPLNEVDPSALSIIANALYFKSTWSDNAFDAALTKEGVFHSPKGERKVKFMTAPAKSRLYANDGKMGAITLDFGNRAYYLTILIPNPELSLAESERWLTPENLSSLRSKMEYAPLEVVMPKLKLEQKENLSAVFAATSLNCLNDMADFTMFTTPESGYMAITQSTSLALDEEGCEAAAVTITNTFTSILDPVQGKVVIDSPFYFFLNEVSTGACLMSGRISEI